MKTYDELLAESLAPDLYITMVDEQTAINTLQAKDNVDKLFKSRDDERRWKTQQKQRTELSKNTPLLNRAKPVNGLIKRTNNDEQSLLQIQHPINTIY